MCRDDVEVGGVQGGELERGHRVGAFERLPVRERRPAPKAFGQHSSKFMPNERNRPAKAGAPLSGRAPLLEQFQPKWKRFSNRNGGKTRT